MVKNCQHKINKIEINNGNYPIPNNTFLVGSLRCEGCGDRQVVGVEVLWISKEGKTIYRKKGIVK